jgi:hypothetical protein
MLRAQWFEVIQYDKKIFASAEAFEEFKESIPETFLFFDIDAFQEDLPVSELNTVMDKLRRGTAAALNSVATYLQG